MSSITSGVGLVSGLPINELVDSLIAAQSRPISQLQSRLGIFAGRRTGLLQISAQLLSIKTAISRFAQSSFFNSATATSSNPTALAVTANSNATVGDYSLVIRNLAAKHQLVSRGFANADQAAVGAGTLTIENAQGQVNRATRLSSLNGGAGVQVGKIRLTDRTGQAATVDLVGAQTINDVVDRINAASGIGIAARVEGDHLVLEDESGGTGALSVAEVGTGKTAGDLGILQSSSTGTLTGDRLVYLAESTRLGDLNDGNGVRRVNLSNDLEFSLGDGRTVALNLSDTLLQSTPLSLLNSGSGASLGRIRITNRAGVSAEVDLTGATNVQDILTRVNAAGINVSLTVTGSRFVLNDTSVASGQSPFGSLKVEDLNGGAAAESLGIAGSAIADRLEGKNVYSVATMGDVLRVINNSPQNRDATTGDRLVTAALSSNGSGITLTDNTGTGLVVNNSNLAQDLGLGSVPGSSNAPAPTTIQSNALVSSLNTVLLRSLNGGSGVMQHDLRIGDRNGGPLVSVNLANATTLDDVINAINAAGTGIRAAVSSSGLGIDLTDSTGGTANIRISGATADSLGIATDSASSSFRGANLQRRYVSEATRRQDFNLGAGIPSGKFRITDSTGASAVVDLTGGELTIQDIIAEINSRGLGIVASINDTGDGLLLRDTAGGSNRLKVSEEGGSVAKALGILGQATAGQNYIDGSLEKRISVDGNDSLNDVLAKIQSSGAAVSATIINDGSGGQSYRLNLVASRSGLNGALAIDAGTTSLTFDALAQARDAVVLIGDASADRPLVVSSSSNTLDGIISGVKLDLIAASEDPVNISVRRDQDLIIEQARTFVNAFNTAIGTLDSLTRFDSESLDRGVLQGDSTARRVRQTLSSLTSASVRDLSGGLNRLNSVGIKLDTGGKLKLDEVAFRAALDANPEGVKDLFALETTEADGEKTVVGLAGVIQKEIDRLTDVENGVITLQEESLQKSETNLNTRISQLRTLLESRRVRLLAQFQNMESVIANLQSQQTAISSLASLIPSA